MLEGRVFQLNSRAIVLTTALINFKTKILSNVLACRLFTVNYPLLLDHILREAKFYLRMLNRLQNREHMGNANDPLEQEVFWNRIMAEHARFKGLWILRKVSWITTPTISERVQRTDQKAIAATGQTALVPGVDGATRPLRVSGLQERRYKGLINCTIKAIAYPLPEITCCVKPTIT